MKKTVRKLPNMNEFSPAVISDLSRLLAIAKRCSGDRISLRNSIARQFAAIDKTVGKQRLNRANNVLIGMSQCGLFDLRKNQLTDIGTSLARLPSKKELHDRFSRHLLLNCHGQELQDVVFTLRGRGAGVTLQLIREELRDRGFHVTENEGNASKLRKWMEQSGVVDSSWNFSDRKLVELLGAGSDVLAEWRSLTLPQRVLLDTLRKTAITRPSSFLDLSPIKQQVEMERGRRFFPEGRFRQAVVDPLRDAGWISTRGTGRGRGGKIGSAKPEKKLLALSSELPVDLGSTIPADLVGRLSTSLGVLMRDLKSGDKNKKGLALELLALRLILDIGLRPVTFRLRSNETRSAEVDIVANGVHLHYSRWLFQCKNTARVEVSDVAKEVGMAVLLKAHVVAMVTTGKFTRAVEDYAQGVSEGSGLQVVLLSGDTLIAYRRSGATAVVEALRQQAENVLNIKRVQVAGAGEA